MPFHELNLPDVFRELVTSRDGLSRQEVVRRAAQFGPNRLPEAKKKPLVLRILKQFQSVLVYILLLAAAISLIFGHTTDAVVIIAIIVLNAAIGFYQERRAERAVEALKKLVVITAKVFRDGSLTKVSAHELVPGDVVLLEEGDRVPADGRILEEQDLRTDEASLTGESLPVSKEITPLPPETPLADQLNMVWMGTLVVGGTGTIVIAATGGNTALGTIAKDVATIKEQKTHFRTRTDELGWTMGAIAVASDAIIFLIGFFVRHLPLLEIFLFAVASLVSGIPEGLPAILTVVLAIGALRMAKRNAVVRHLPATETLAVTTVIATDKTGTLTQNTMTVRKIVLGDGSLFEVSGIGWNPSGEITEHGAAVRVPEIPGLYRLAHIAGIGVSAKVFRTDHNHEIFGDPTEAALVVLAEKAGLPPNHLAEESTVLSDFPFERSHKYRARLVRHHKRGGELYVIGAFEQIVSLASHTMDRDGIRAPLTAELKKRILTSGEALASQALRVLGVAFREFPDATTASHDDMRELTLVGLAGMIDPPKPEVAAAVANAKRAGIRIIMKTGDHRKTAVAIAQEIGLLKANDQNVLTEVELARMNDDEFDRAVITTSVFARVTPQTKLRICRALQRQGAVVAMTGDGVNDAPALRQADIGIAMGKIGTDVARAASGLILVDDNFATIVGAIEEGRVVFRNTQQTSFYLVTTNIAEDVAVLGAIALGLPLPLLPIHLLWMNIVTDGLPALALASEPKHDDVLLRPPYKKEEKILSKKMLPFLTGMVVIMTVGTLFLFFTALPHGLEKARTIAFAFMAWTQLWNVWNLRSLERSIFQIGLATNRFLVVAFLAGIALQFLVFEIPFLQTAFHFSPLTPQEWGLVIASSALVLVFGELFKRFRSVDTHSMISV